MKAQKIPTGLQEPGAKFYRQMIAERDFVECQDLERLFMLARCKDEIAESEAVLLREGRFIEDRWHQKREHPAAKAIRDSRIIFCRIVRELGLDLTAPTESRPPRQY